MRVDGVDRGADVLPVHLWCVVLSAARTEEHRVGERRMEIDVREAGQRDREVPADQASELADIGLGLDVLALVLALGVDQQAVGTVLDGGRSELGLGHGMVAIHVLPGAHPQPGGMQGGDERTVELRPRGAAVAALDLQRGDPVVLGLGDDRGQVAAVRARELPDPHAPARERDDVSLLAGAAGRSRLARAGSAGARASRGGDRRRAQAEREHGDEHRHQARVQLALACRPTTPPHAVLQHTASHRSQKPGKCLQVAVR